MRSFIAVVFILVGSAFAVIDFNGLQWRVGPDMSMTWYEAQAWVDGLGGDWRMPTITELRGLWEAGISRDNWGLFENSGSWVWSSEVPGSSSAWYFGFQTGAEFWRPRSDSGFSRVFAVRSPQDVIETASVWTERYGNDGGLELGREQTSSGGEVIEYNSLYWLVGPDRDMDWDEAKEWVDDLGGNWRMPYRAELQGLWDAGISDDNWGPFENSGLRVWSGEVQYPSSAWYFDFSPGYESCGLRVPSYYWRAFAVRPL